MSTCVILVRKQIILDAIIWTDDIIKGSSHYHLEQVPYRIESLQRPFSINVEELSIFLIHLKLITYYTPKISEDISPWNFTLLMLHRSDHCPKKYLNGLYYQIFIYDRRISRRKKLMNFVGFMLTKTIELFTKRNRCIPFVTLITSSFYFRKFISNTNLTFPHANLST